MNIGRFAALCGALAILAPVVHAQTPTKLQVTATRDKASAEQVVNRLNQAGFGPAEILAQGELFKVQTRGFESYAEAQLVKPKLQNAGFTGVFAVSAATPENTQAKPEELFGDAPAAVRVGLVESVALEFGKTTVNAKPAAPQGDFSSVSDESASEEQLFEKVNGFRGKGQPDAALKSIQAFVKRFPDSAKVPTAKLLEGYMHVAKGDLDQAHKKFDEVAAQYPALPEAGEARLRKAYLTLREKKSDAEALKSFHEVASGKLTASAEVRLEAMLRCAALYHKGKDLDTAEAAYTVIEGSTKDPEVQAYSAMQRAGIIMEKAWNKNASFSQALALCDQLLKSYPQVNRQTRATAALMALECLCYDKQFAEVVAREQGFVQEFSGTAEGDLGFYWIAVGEFETGNLKKAADILEQIIAAGFPTQERFKHVFVEVSARRLASKVYERMGDHERARKVQLGNN